MKKQIILTFGALATTLAPIITLISCGNKEDPYKQPFAFNGDRNKLPNTDSVHNIGSLYAKVTVESGTYYSKIGPIYANNGALSNQAALKKLAAWLNLTKQKFNNYLVMESNTNISFKYIGSPWVSKDYKDMTVQEQIDFDTTYENIEWSTTDFRYQ